MTKEEQIAAVDKSSLDEAADVTNFAFMIAEVMKTVIVKPAEFSKTTKRRCNRHEDCDLADERARQKGCSFADHCDDKYCEDCFGQ